MSISEIRDSFINEKIDLVKYYEELIEKVDSSKDLNILISFDKEHINNRIEDLLKKKDSGEKLGKLFGVPFTFKDNISTKGIKTTCGSKSLEDYIPVFDATIIERILSEDGVILGKANMDEYAMGSSSETSYFGPTKNPLNNKLIPGGSSSGSAASVAQGLAPVSIGSDTGGSVRQPSSYCNVIGYYPSYGNISRYGIVSMANTLDQAGIVANNIEDIITTVNIIGGNDEKDMTSTEVHKLNFKISNSNSMEGLKIGVIKLEDFPIDPIVKKDYEDAIEQIKNIGGEIIDLDFKYIKYSSSVYSVVMAAEVSSNMARFDGIRYGHVTDDYHTTKELFVKTRSEGFGEEVQRRIAMGTHYLASENNQALYKQGLKVRKLMKEEFKSMFDKVDVIITPTTTDLPYELGSRTEDPLAMYDSGTFNVPVNLCGLCAISVPVRKGISGSIQIIGDRNNDELILNVAHSFLGRKN